MTQREKILSELQTLGLVDSSHSKGKLLDHLVGTYDLLESWGSSSYLSNAGLCHSIYGTESFSKVSLEKDHRDQVSTIIGSKAEKLVYLFCAHEKESLWANQAKADGFTIFDRFCNQLITVSEEEYRDMITLTLANWLEQYPRVKERYKSLRKEEFLASKDLLPEAAYNKFLEEYNLPGK